MPIRKIDKNGADGELMMFPGETRIKFKDIFDMKEFYAAIHFWYQEYGWDDGYPFTREGFWYETNYDERVDTGGAKEMWIRWRLEKRPQHRDMVKYYMDVDMHVLALKGTEVIKNGQKIKTNKGEVEFNVKTYIHLLAGTGHKEFKEGLFAPLKKALFTTMLPIMGKRMYQVPELKRELYNELYIMQNFLKQWFRLKRYLPYEEVKNFHPSLAWPSHQKD